MLLSRRRALIGSVATGVSACATQPNDRNLSEKAAFQHGVASGDPTSDGFVIWTRVSPGMLTTPITVKWEVSSDVNFNSIVKQGQQIARSSKDWTVKVEVDNLEPGRRWFYRFRTDETMSTVGRSQTLPIGDRLDKLRFAVVSCSNYPFGYFNVYDHIAKQHAIDAVIHLGDYIYEYGPSGYGGSVGESLERSHVPAKEIISLNDYRMRHAQYKSDPSSQKMHAAHPLIAIWDDHETTNNSWEGGAENHQMDEGNWDLRRSAALQAYYEWMPVRDPKPGKTKEALFKSYDWGNLLSLATIETRLTARSEQLEYTDIIPKLKTPGDISKFKTEVLGDPKRRLLGASQSDYIRNSFNRRKVNGAPWQVVANKVIMADVAAPDISDFAHESFIDAIEKQLPQIRDFLAFTALGLPLNLDAWDGYPAAREAFYALAKQSRVNDLVVFTGDTHEFWANNLTTKDGQMMGVELATSAVTSPGASEYFGPKAQEYSKRLEDANASVLYHSPQKKGYIDVVFTAEKAIAKFISVDTVLSSRYKTTELAKFQIKHLTTNHRGLELSRIDSLRQ